jgi:hypothetical protein
MLTVKNASTTTLSTGLSTFEQHICSATSFGTDKKILVSNKKTHCKIVPMMEARYRESGPRSRVERPASNLHKSISMCKNRETPHVGEDRGSATKYEPHRKVLVSKDTPLPAYILSRGASVPSTRSESLCLTLFNFRLAIISKSSARAPKMKLVALGIVVLLFSLPAIYCWPSSGKHLHRVE